MHNTMRNTIQNGISHSITSVLPIKRKRLGDAIFSILIFPFSFAS